jgi:hypothetical protein
MALTDAERVEAFTKLAESGFVSFNERRKYEWKVNFGLWTALAIMIGFGATTPVHKLRFLNGYLFLVPHLLVFISYWLWTAGLHARNSNDKKFWELYRMRAEFLVDGRPEWIFKEKDHDKFFGWFLKDGRWSKYPQIVFTFILILANLFLYWPRLGF